MIPGIGVRKCQGGIDGQLPPRRKILNHLLLSVKAKLVGIVTLEKVESLTKSKGTVISYRYTLRVDDNDFFFLIINRSKVFEIT